MHHPKLLRAKYIRSAIIPAALLCVIPSGCNDEQPTGPALQRVSRDAGIVDLPFDRFFVAWSQTYSATPIQTQLFAIDARQVRQYGEFEADGNLLAFARANPGRLYINGDEPDQYCIPPYDYAAVYRDFVTAVRSADPTARFSPAGVAEPNYYCCPPPADEPCKASMHGIGYLDRFYKAYVQRYGVAPPVDEWRFHDFGVAFAAGDMASWWSRIDAEAAWSVAHVANMVLGSWGFIGWREPEALFQEHLKQAMGLILNDKRITGAAYWSHSPWVNSPHYLVDSDGTLTPQGQTFANPLTDVPAAAKLVGSGNGQANLKWRNTTSAWGTETEFWVQAPGANAFVIRKTERVASPGAKQSPFVAFSSGDRVKARVRYYNVYGQAGWSDFSNTVVIVPTEAEAEQRRVFGKSGFFCLMQSC